MSGLDQKVIHARYDAERCGVGLREGIVSCHHRNGPGTVPHPGEVARMPYREPQETYERPAATRRDGDIDCLRGVRDVSVGAERPRTSRNIDPEAGARSD